MGTSTDSETWLRGERRKVYHYFCDGTQPFRSVATMRLEAVAMRLGGATVRLKGASVHWRLARFSRGWNKAMLEAGGTPAVPVKRLIGPS